MLDENYVLQLDDYWGSYPYLAGGDCIVQHCLQYLGPRRNSHGEDGFPLTGKPTKYLLFWEDCVFTPTYTYVKLCTNVIYILRYTRAILSHLLSNVPGPDLTVTTDLSLDSQGTGVTPRQKVPGLQAKHLCDSGL